MNKHVFDLVLDSLAIFFLLCIPGGLIGMLYFDNAWWMALTAFGIIILSAG